MSDHATVFRITQRLAACAVAITSLHACAPDGHGHASRERHSADVGPLGGPEDAGVALADPVGEVGVVSQALTASDCEIAIVRNPHLVDGWLVRSDARARCRGALRATAVRRELYWHSPSGWTRVFGGSWEPITAPGAGAQWTRTLSVQGTAYCSRYYARYAVRYRRYGEGFDRMRDVISPIVRLPC